MLPSPPSVHIYWPYHQISNVKIERWIKRFIGKLHWFKKFKVGSYLSGLQLSLFPSILVTQVGGKSPGEAGRLVARARIRIREVFWYIFHHVFRASLSTPLALVPALPVAPEDSQGWRPCLPFYLQTLILSSFLLYSSKQSWQRDFYSGRGG